MQTPASSGKVLDFHITNMLWSLTQCIQLAIRWEMWQTECVNSEGHKTSLEQVGNIYTVSVKWCADY